MVAGQLSPWYNVPRWSIETGEKLQHGCWSSSRLCWTIMGGGRGSRACKGMCEGVCEFEVCVCGQVCRTHSKKTGAQLSQGSQPGYARWLMVSHVCAVFRILLLSH